MLMTFLIWFNCKVWSSSLQRNAELSINKGRISGFSFQLLAGGSPLYCNKYWRCSNAEVYIGLFITSGQLQLQCTVRPGRWREVWTSEMIIIRKWWDVWEWLVWGGGGGGEAKWLGSCPLTASLPPPSSPTLTSPSTPTPTTTLPTPPPPPASWGPGPGPGPGVVCAEDGRPPVQETWRGGAVCPGSSWELWVSPLLTSVSLRPRTPPVSLSRTVTLYTVTCITPGQAQYRTPTWRIARL